MIVFHIGLNKTGSSAIQDFFFSNRGALLDRGILYPEAGLAPAAHHGLATYLDAPSSSPELDEAYSAAMRHDGLVVFSSEALQDARNLTRLKAFVAGRPVKVVVYLRDPVTYIRSWWQQDIQTPSLTCGLATYARLHWKSYSNILRRWGGAFGRDSLIVRSYERRRFPQHDVLRDFLKLTGTEHLAEELPRKDYDLNPSIGGNLLFAKLLFNAMGLPGADSAQLSDGLTELAKLKPEFAIPPVVDRDLAAAIFASYREDLAIVAHEFGTNIALSSDTGGTPTPDLSTLAEDLRLIWSEADKLGLSLSSVRSHIADAVLPKTT